MPSARRQQADVTVDDVRGRGASPSPSGVAAPSDVESNRTWVLYVAIVSVVGVGVAPFMLTSPDVRAALSSGGFWLFSAFVFLGELFPLRVHMRDELTENTTSVTFTFALLLEFGAGAAVLPNIIASAVGDVRQGKSPLRILFNISQYTISIAGASVVYQLFGGARPLTEADLLAIAASGATMYLVNILLTSVAVGLWQRVPLLPYVGRNVVFSAHMTPALIALAPVVVLVAEVGLWFVPLFAIPIAAVYWGMTKALENSRLVERLRESLEQMTELNRMKDDFVAVVSHELRTPLTSIQGYVKTLLQLGSELDADQERSFLEAADRQSDRLRNLIEQLLVVARMETHTEPLVLAPVSVPSIASNVVDELGPRANGHTFELRFEPDVPIVKSDDGKVHQILSNLVENALKYSPPDTRVTIRVARGVNGVIAAVQDQGGGIPEDQQEHIFERFYQVDSSATRRVGGTGLGLYICRKMADQLGGRIWLDSSGHDGTTFCLFLPLSPLASDPAATQRAAPAGRAGDQSMTASV